MQGLRRELGQSCPPASVGYSTSHKLPLHLHPRQNSVCSPDMHVLVYHCVPIPTAPANISNLLPSLSAAKLRQPPSFPNHPSHPLPLSEQTTSPAHQASESAQEQGPYHHQEHQRGLEQARCGNLNLQP